MQTNNTAINQHAAAMDLTGNMPIIWKETAEKLLIASHILKKQREMALGAHKSKFLSNPKSPPDFPKEGHIHWVELMLTGFAIENLLKGLWLANGNNLYENAKIRSGILGPSHDLVVQATRVGFALDDTERGDLQMLKKIMTGIGRYPMMSNETQGPSSVSWTYQSDVRMKLLLTRLQNQLDATEAKNGVRNGLSRVTVFRRKMGEQI